MAKQRAPNPDYFKESGGEVGRGAYSREKRKLAEGHGAAGMAHPPAAHKPSIASTGAGAETIQRAQRRQADKARKASEARAAQEMLERAIDANAHRAPPERQLPSARLTTELGDLRRQMVDDLDHARRAARELYESVMGMIAMPMRLFRVLREAATG